MLRIWIIWLNSTAFVIIKLKYICIDTILNKLCLKIVLQVINLLINFSEF